MPPTIAQTAPAFADPAGEASAGFGLNAAAAWRAEYEDRRVLLPPLPPVAQDFVEEIHTSKSVDVRALLQQLDDEWTRRILLPATPVALEDWTWSKDFSPLFVKPLDAEPFGLGRPIVTPLAYDQNDWPRRFEWFYAPQTAELDLASAPPPAPSAFEDGEGSRDFTEKRFWLESDVLLGVPIAPFPAWDEPSNFFTGYNGSLAVMLVLDEFVNVPTGSGTFGSAPLGRSARLGFSSSSFR